MRAIWFCVGLLCATLSALAADPQDHVERIEGGFAAHSASYAVTFQIAGLTATQNSAPTVAEWTSAQGTIARLEVCVVKDPADAAAGPLLAARAVLSNAGSQPFQTTLSVAIIPRPTIPALAFEQHAFSIAGKLALISESPSRGAILAQEPLGERPFSPQDAAHVESARGECRGEMLFDLLLAPGQTQSLGFLCPARSSAKLDAYRRLSVEKLFADAEKGTAR